MSSNQSDYLYSGGVAEFVARPSQLTYSFLTSWFSTKSSYGLAMKMLGLPFVKSDKCFLKLIDGELFIDLKVEERILYQNTLFSYSKQKNTSDTPHLFVNYRKLFNPVCTLNTLKIIGRQTSWILNPDNVALILEKRLNGLKDVSKLTDAREIDKYISLHVLPLVITTGYMAEFYHQVVSKKNEPIEKYLGKELSDDWYVRSYTDQWKVKQGDMSFDEYIKLYGARADNDYELTCPRWHEIQSVVKKRIQDLSPRSLPEKKDGFAKSKNSSIATYIQFQELRTLVKKEFLFSIDQLRKSIFEKSKKNEDLSRLTRDTVLFGKKTMQIAKSKSSHGSKPSHLPAKGKGVAVSGGKVSGDLYAVLSASDHIPKNNIVVFPNASPEFSMLYPRCKGMIFLRGGVTSHGAIVAREYGIPAIVDSMFERLSQKSTIEIDGSTGEWKIV